MKEYQFDVTLSITIEAEDELEAKSKAISRFIDKYGQDVYENVFAFDLFDVIELEEKE
jgi:hypothetical protein